jgi:aminopeptidase
MERLMRQAAEAIVNKAAFLRKGCNVLVICGLHNKGFAEGLVLESYAACAYPYLWVFDENLLLQRLISVSEETVATLPDHVRSLLERSDVIIWLSQFENLERFPPSFRKAVCSFWDKVYEAVKSKPRLLVNLPSARSLEGMGIEYGKFLKTFASAVNVDFENLRQLGTRVAARISGKRLIHVRDANGTDLTFSIENRHVGIEVGTLEDCLSTGEECEVDVPSGEVYVAPLENSANGTLGVKELRDYGIQRLTMLFERGKIVRFKAEKGIDVFQRMLDTAEGDRDRIAELGIGINNGMKPVGWSIYDEKALGTAHIAIGNNIHLGGTNKSSIHVDFVLHKPTIKADNELLMEKGEITR